jgi:hypothetical protein
MAATAGHKINIGSYGKMFKYPLGGGHLGFPIGIKKQKLCRGSSNDHSWAVWFQLSKWFQRRSVAGLSLTLDPMGKIFKMLLL